MSESLLNWNDYLQVASLSDVGMRRTTNQDNLTVSLASNMDSFQRKGHLFIVADGMGAHAAGELASKLAIDHIPHLYSKHIDSSSNYSTAPENLRQAVTDANGEIYRRGQANEEFYNMGTTCSTLLLLPQGAVAAHIGDSRVYRLSQNRLEQLTFDHSLVWEMKAAGQLTEAEEKTGRVPRNVITRSLGPYRDCNVDLEGPFPIQVGDTFLLCSDGLTGVITDAEIGSILANMDPDEGARVLVDLGNLRGGPDNITVIIVKVTHPQLATSRDAAPLVANSKKNSLNPVWWAIIAGLAFLTTLFYFVSNWETALLPGVALIGCLIYVFIRMIMASGGATLGSVNRFGKGPHTRTACSSGPEFSKQLAGTIDELQAGAQKQDWKVDWARWKALVTEAESAVQEKNYSHSIRAYGRAISFLMEQLRNQQDSGSSSVDL
jgi:serine/threonine protein phosphatase PrpC